MNWDWEISRLVLAIMAGTVLSHTGSLVQLTSRNEMASPSTMGMDGVAVAIVLLIYLLQSAFSLPYTLEELGLITVIVCAVALRFLPARLIPYQGARGQDFRFMLLLGLSINLLVGAVFAVMQFLAMAFDHEFPDQLWFGRIDTLAPLHLVGSLIVMIGLLLIGLRHRLQWKALLLGHGWCHGLGIPVQQVTKDALWIAFVGNLWVITQFGAFSFLGLLFPILLRQIPRYQGHPWRELTEGALVSGLLFALLDHACFNLTFHGAEIPVGLPASMIGSAVLVILLWRRFLSSGSLGKDPQRV